MTDNTATALPALPEPVQRLKAALEALEALAPLNNMATDGEVFRLFHRRIDAAAAFVHAASPEAVRALLDAVSAVRASAGAVEVRPVHDSIDVSRDDDGDLCVDFRGPAFTASVSVPDGPGIVSVAWSVGQYRGTASMAKPEPLPAAPSALTARPAVALTEEQMRDYVRSVKQSNIVGTMDAALYTMGRAIERAHGIPSAPSANERKE